MTEVSDAWFNEGIRSIFIYCYEWKSATLQAIHGKLENAE